MNPIFIAHLVADFLFQPTWLVKLKEKSIKGITIHALIHALVLALLSMAEFPNYIILIAFIHGIIDYVKIHYFKTFFKFELSFLIDQLIHLITLVILNDAVYLSPRFVDLNAQYLIYGLLVFFSFGVGLWNLMHIKNHPGYNFAQKTIRVFAVTLTVLSFIALAI